MTNTKLPQTTEQHSGADPALSNSTGLLACPMCGSEAAFNEVRYSSKMIREQNWGQDTFHGVNCTRCGLDNKGLVGHRTQAAAATAWNKRAPTQAYRFAGWFSEMRSGMTYRLWEQGGHEQRPGDVALYVST